MNKNFKKFFPSEEICLNALRALHLDKDIQSKITDANKQRVKVNLSQIISDQIEHEVQCYSCYARAYRVNEKILGYNYKCKMCKIKFNERTNTLFQASQMELRQAMAIVFLNNLNQKKKDFTIADLGEYIGVSSKTVGRFIQKINFIKNYESLNQEQKEAGLERFNLKEKYIDYNKELMKQIIRYCYSVPDIQQLVQTLKETEFSFISYPGSKASIAKFLIKKLPRDFKNYIEPFVGGGSCVFAVNIFGLPNDNEDRKFFISDQNKGLIDSYNDLKDHSQELYDNLEQYATEFNNASIEDRAAKWNDIKNDYNKNLISGVKRSAAFIFITKTSFNGAFDFKDGKFYCSCNKDKKFSLSKRMLFKFKRCSDILQNNFIINNCSYKEIEAFLQPGDFIFLDPPYFGYKKNTITYDSNEARKDGQEELRDFLLRIHEKGVYFMMCNYSTSYLEKNLYKDRNIFNIEDIEVSRNISSTNKKELEIIVRNYK